MRVRVGEKIDWLGSEAIIVGCTPNSIIPAVVLDITKGIDLPIEPRRVGECKHEMWAANIKANRPHMKHGIKGLYGTKKGKTCIIAGSGASLDPEAVKRFKGADVIACNDAYRLLDGNAEYAMFMDGADLPVMDKWWSVIKRKTKAILCGFVTPRASSQPWTRMYWFGLLPRLYGVPENQELIEEFGALALQLNVTYSALHFAVQAGYSRILFVGLDFAYTNGYSHYGEEAKAFTDLKRYWYQVADSIQGGLTLTDEILAIQARMHEAGAWFANRAGIEVVNCTEGGIMSGMPCGKLSDYSGEV